MVACVHFVNHGGCTTTSNSIQFCTKIQAYRTTAVILPAKNGTIQLIGHLLSLVPNADGASERRLINKINTMIGTEPEEADVTQVANPLVTFTLHLVGEVQLATADGGWTSREILKAK
ncbi:unnamed protein product, partial [Ascophyllum nodosum]